MQELENEGLRSLNDDISKARDDKDNLLRQVKGLGDTSHRNTVSSKVETYAHRGHEIWTDRHLHLWLAYRLRSDTVLENATESVAASERLMGEVKGLLDSEVRGGATKEKREIS
jgi:hypothetical protein